MTRIIAADGTRFVPETEGRRRMRRIAAIVSLIIAAPFMAAAVIGLYLGATQGLPTPAPTMAPSASTIALPKPLPAALRACRPAPRQFQGYCIALYLRPSYTLTQADGSKVHTPAGPALVKECMTQGLTRSELGYCLTQPIG